MNPKCLCLRERKKQKQYLDAVYLTVILFRHGGNHTCFMLTFKNKIKRPAAKNTKGPSKSLLDKSPGRMAWKGTRWQSPMDGEERLIDNMVDNNLNEVRKSVWKSNNFWRMNFLPPWELLEICEGVIGCQVLGPDTLNILQYVRHLHIMKSYLIQNAKAILAKAHCEPLSSFMLRLTLALIILQWDNSSATSRTHKPPTCEGDDFNNN